MTHMGGLDSRTFTVLGDLPYQRVRRLISLGLGVGIQALILCFLAVVGILIPSKMEIFSRRAPIYVELRTPSLTKNILIPKKSKPTRIKIPRPQEIRIQKPTILIDRTTPKIRPLETDTYISLPVRPPPTVSLVKNTPKAKPTPVTTGVFGNSNGIIGDAKGSSLGNVAKLGSFDFLPGGVHGNTTRNTGGIVRGVSTSGFNNKASPPGNNLPKKTIVRPGGFDKKPSAKNLSQSLPKIVTDLPVEIISKPEPIYTEEGIKLGIEGEVILEVVFLASGKISILKVLKGLGHGLDESAHNAAKKIKFKPGQRQGESVNVKARLRVIFQLAGGS